MLKSPLPRWRLGSRAIRELFSQADVTYQFNIQFKPGKAYSRRGSISTVGMFLSGLVLVGVCLLAWVIRSDREISHLSDQPLVGSAAEQPQQDELTFLHPVQINRPHGPPQLESGSVDSAGKSIMVQCAVCHVTRQPNFENRSAGDLQQFHRDLTVTHGSVSCLSCHNPEDYQSLRLADGTKVEYEEVIQLCGQCHGPQLRDYEKGVHGGMNGYWDLRLGPQFKNNCVDCHPPHHPKFPQMQTGFKPIDRFLPAEVEVPSGGSHE